MLELEHTSKQPAEPTTTGLAVEKWTNPFFCCYERHKLVKISLDASHIMNKTFFLFFDHV